MSNAENWPSDGTCRQCGAAPRHPLNGLCATCEDEWPCTDCDGTGIAYQTERRCACQPPEEVGRPPHMIALVDMVETVTGDFGTEPGEPFWRIEIAGYVADFDHSEAANNFANAINDAVLSALHSQSVKE